MHSEKWKIMVIVLAFLPVVMALLTAFRTGDNTLNSTVNVTPNTETKEALYEIATYFGLSEKNGTTYQSEYAVMAMVEGIHISLFAEMVIMLSDLIMWIPRLCNSIFKKEW